MICENAEIKCPESCGYYQTYMRTLDRIINRIKLARFEGGSIGAINELLAYVERLKTEAITDGDKDHGSRSER
jgi:hypothetical protein